MIQIDGHTTYTLYHWTRAYKLASIKMRSAELEGKYEAAEGNFACKRINE